MFRVQDTWPIQPSRSPAFVVMFSSSVDEWTGPQILARDIVEEIESWQCWDIDIDEIRKVVDTWVEKGVKYVWMISKLSVDNIESKFPMDEMADANLWIQHVRDKMIEFERTRSSAPFSSDAVSPLSTDAFQEMTTAMRAISKKVTRSGKKRSRDE